MAVGLSIPFRADQNGTLAKSTPEETAWNTIYLTLSDVDNDNAFQQGMDITQQVIFKPDDKVSRAKVMAKLISAFEQFEDNKLFKLDLASVEWYKETSGESILEFQYLDLETDEVSTFRRSYGGT